MRIVIYGAGAIGGVIGARMVDAGHDVVLIARGDHLAAMQRDGLRLDSVEGSRTFHIPAVAGPAEVRFRDDDVVLLATKTQHTRDALAALLPVAPRSVHLVCAQNGVENEREASRWFSDVHAMTVTLPASHMQPGVVVQHSTPLAGTLDLGRYPNGSDVVDGALSRALQRSGFRSEVQADPMRSKYAKLLVNLINILDAACGREARYSDIADAAREEGRMCLHAAGIDYMTAAEEAERREGLSLREQDPGSIAQPGSSTMQSLARGGTLETDYLNGEIVLLGRIHGVPTPVNSMLQHLAWWLQAEHRPPGSVSLDDLRTRLLTAGVDLDPR